MGRGSTRSVSLLLVALLATASLACSAKADCRPGYGNSGGKCNACAAGTYSTVVKGKRVCQACPVAFYSDTTKATACKQCPPGLWTGFAGTKSKSGCYPCYPLDAIPQVPLPDGKGGLACQRCPEGSYPSKDGSKCLQCMATGHYIYKYRTCATCPPGTRHNGRKYASTVGHACEPCAFNTYQDQPAQASCKACPTGTFVLKKGSKSAAACQAYLAGKSLSFTQSISTVTKEGTFRPQRSSYHERKSAKRTAVTVPSGATYSCDLPAAERLVAVDGGKLVPTSLDGRRTQCKSITLYLLPGNRYSVAVQFRVPFKPDQWAAFSGRVAAGLKLRLRYKEASKGLRTYVLTEDIKWTGATLK